MKRLLITGTRSGCGKTTVACALLSALKARGIEPVAFKCGPDYIDPMFHRAASGIRAYNLDPYFLDGENLRRHLAKHAGEFSLIEGAMGYYDGIAATEEASAHTVARETETPVVLVISAKGAGASLGALIKGFAQHRQDSHIAGVIFNDASEGRYADLRKIARNAGMPAYGYLPRRTAWRLPSRRLGLLAPEELGDLQNILRELGEQALRSVDIDGLLALAGKASVLRPDAETPCIREKGLRLAVAKDNAFCFLYEENLEILREKGCEIVFFSPLRDETLPSGCHGLYLCGGYPELHEAALRESRLAAEIRQAIALGLPTIAECGGFLYLHYIGLIRAKAQMTNRLQTFGYAELIAQRDNLLCKKGGSIRAHEFHYAKSDSPGDSFLARKAGRNISWPCVHATDTLYAGFPHLYFPANPAFAEGFLERMTQYAL